MCRSIRTLFNFEPPASEEEIRAASLQFVRKVSGFAQPSRTVEAAFNEAVAEISGVVRHLLDSMMTSSAPRDRVVESARSRPQSIPQPPDFPS